MMMARAMSKLIARLPCNTAMSAPANDPKEHPPRLKILGVQNKAVSREEGRI